MTRLGVLAALLTVVGLVVAAPVPKAVKKTPPYPYDMGTKWEYIRDGDPQKVQVEEVVEVEEKDGVVRFKTDITTPTGEKTFEWYTIKNGEIALTNNGGSEFDPPMLIRKDVMKEGDEWAVTWGVKSGQRGVQYSSEQTLTIGKAEEVTTPAGKFTAIPVIRKYNGATTGMTMWYSDGVGMIRHTQDGQKEPVQELKSFTRGKK